MPVDVFLITKSEDDTERIVARAEAESAAGACVYRFGKGGSRFCIEAGAVPRVAREGELSYELVLDPAARTRARIRSPYGEIEVLVRTQRVEWAQTAEGGRLFCAYELDFSGTVRKHTMTLSAKRVADQ